MPEPFPSKAYQELCIEKRDELPEWEPRVGDWIWCAGDEQFQPITALIAKIYPSFPNRERCAEVSSDNMIWGPTELTGDWTWLPTQCELIEMLEERGRCWHLFRTGEWLQAQGAGAYRVVWGDGTTWVDGPDPETALLRCLLAVMEKEEE